MLKELLGVLNNDIKQNNLIGKVEILTNDEMDITVGHKRNLLLKKATGKFIVYIDDDDMVVEDYVTNIVNAIENNRNIDCIAINGTYSVDGGAKQKWFISKDYNKWYEERNIYYRTPNHISPVKREIALLCGFPSMSFSEDYHYSMAILPHLKKEATIEKPLYHYKFISEK